MFNLVLEKAEEPEIKLTTSAGSSKKQESSKKHLFLLCWLPQSLWLCGLQQTVENSERDGNTSPPDLPPVKPVCRSRSNSKNRTWTTDWFHIGKGIHLVKTRLYIVTLLISLLCWAHHAKGWAGWSTNWNENCHHLLPLPQILPSSKVYSNASALCTR